jgi:hypothetical protein
MRHRAGPVLLLVLSLPFLGCGNRPQDRETTVEPPPEASAADAGPAAPDPLAPERRWVVYAGELRLLEISDRPGIIVDSTAPPPPPVPGATPTTHPFLTAGCGGDPLLCSRAGVLLRESTSLPEFLDKLRGEGWRVEEVPAAPPG